MEQQWNDDIKKHFDFLYDYDFSGPIIYSNGPEMNFDYISKNSIINITYEPDYDFLTRLVKLKTEFKKIESSKIRWRTLKKSEYKVYDIGLFLDPKNTFKDSIGIRGQREKSLEYYSRLLKANTKVLEGNFSDFTIRSAIRKCLN